MCAKIINKWSGIISVKLKSGLILKTKSSAHLVVGKAKTMGHILPTIHSKQKQTILLFNHELYRPRTTWTASASGLVLTRVVTPLVSATSSLDTHPLPRCPRHVIRPGQPPWHSALEDHAPHRRILCFYHSAPSLIKSPARDGWCHAAVAGLSDSVLTGVHTVEYWSRSLGTSSRSWFSLYLNHTAHFDLFYIWLADSIIHNVKWGFT